MDAEQVAGTLKLAIANALRAMALPTTKQRALATPFASAERIINDSVIDALESARAFCRETGVAIYPADTWLELEKLERILVEVYELILNSRSNDATIDQLWVKVTTMARKIVQERGWDGPIDLAHFQYFDSASRQWITPDIDATGES